MNSYLLCYQGVFRTSSPRLKLADETILSLPRYNGDISLESNEIVGILRPFKVNTKCKFPEYLFCLTVMKSPLYNIKLRFNCSGVIPTSNWTLSKILINSDITPSFKSYVGSVIIYGRFWGSNGQILGIAKLALGSLILWCLKYSFAVV